MVGFQRLADELATHLRDRIVMGDLSGGETLAEASLSQEYDVARPTARTAIDMLVLDGLVTKRPHMPAVVAKISTDEIPEILGLLEKSEELALESLLTSDPDTRALRKMSTASTAALLDKLVDLSQSQRLCIVHRRSTFEFMLAQLDSEVGFVDDAQARTALVESVMILDRNAAQAALHEVQKLRADSVAGLIGVALTRQ